MPNSLGRQAEVGAYPAELCCARSGSRNQLREPTGATNVGTPGRQSRTGMTEAQAEEGHVDLVIAIDATIGGAFRGVLRLCLGRVRECSWR